MRKRIQELQKTLRQIKNPEVRKALEAQISEALKSVSDLMSGKKPGEGGAGTPATPGQPAKPGASTPGGKEGTSTSTKTNEKE